MERIKFLGRRARVILLTVLFVVNVQVQHILVLLLIRRDNIFTTLAWSSWNKCGTNCRRNRTRNCTGEYECNESKIYEEECQDGDCDPSKVSLYQSNISRCIISTYIHHIIGKPDEAEEFY